jgi:hypothetical protein
LAVYTPAAVVGMTSLTATPGTSVLSGTSGHTYIVRTWAVQTNASSKTFTASIGADAAGTRLWDAYALTQNVPAIFNGWWVKAGSGAAHDIDSSCSATTVTLLASGYDYN